MSDEFDEFHLEQELRRAEEREEQRSPRMKGLLFLAMWWLPLFGMEISGYEPKADVGQVSVLGLRFIGVPVVYGPYCYVNKRKNE